MDEPNDDQEPSETPTNGPERESENSQNPREIYSISQIMDNPQLFHLFMTEIDQRVSKRLDEKRQRKRTWFFRILGLSLTSMAIVATLLAAYGEDWFGITFHNIKSAIRGEAPPSVAYDIKVGTLNFDIMRKSQGEDFNDREEKATVERILRLFADAPGSEEVLNANRDKLKYAAETLMRRFLRTNRIELVAKIDDQAEKLLQDNDNVLQTMVGGLGRALLADPGAPRSWTDNDGTMKETYRLFRKYARKAEEKEELVAFVVVHELLLRYLEDLQPQDFKGLIKAVRELNENNAGRFKRIINGLVRESDGSDNRSSRTISDTVKKFICEYKGRIPFLSDIAKDLKLEC